MSHARRRLLVTLPLLLLCGVFVATRVAAGLSTWTRHLVIDALWTLFSLAAALACAWTARRVPRERGRAAWWLFAAGCFCWFLGMLEWTRLELLEDRLNPFPSLADPLYLAMPLLFIAGMANLRLDMRTRPRSLLQVANVGLAMVGVAVVVSLALAAPARGGGDAAGSSDGLRLLVLAANVVLYSADFLFGLYCLSVTPAIPGPRRILTLIVVGQGVNVLVVLAYVREVFDSSYSVGGWLDVGFCILFGMVILAAHEQSLEPKAAAAPSVHPPLTRLDTLIPALILGAVTLAVIPYWKNLAWIPPWLLLLEGLLLSLFIGLHGVASRRIQADLHQELRRSEERLREGQKLESLGLLASGLAHDFNNVLTIVNGHATLLRGRGDREESLRAIEEAVAQGAELSRNLLGLARPSDETRAAVDVRHLLGVIARLVRSSVPASIAVRTECPELPPVELAAGPVQQALLNLALNARDAMPEGGEMVLGARTSGEGQARRLELFVRDTGQGMDQALVERVLEPFFTTKTEEGGSGLGLAMVAHVARRHGGAATVHSRPGAGTTVVLSLPAPQGARADGRSARPV